MNRDIVVIGGSAGAIDAIRIILAALPKDFPASIFIVLHTAAESPGVLGQIFDRAGPLRSSQAVNAERIMLGHVYVPPPDHHLLVEPGSVRLTRGPKENRFRPAIDPLFRSAAQTYGPRVIGVILTGGLDDGTAGLWAIKRLGGTTIVQDPGEALAPSMPRSALRHVQVDHVLKVAEIGPMLIRLTATPTDHGQGDAAMGEDIKIELRIAKEDKALDAGLGKLADPSIFACPECHGVLMQMKNAVPPRFRCHTGHAFTADSLLADMDEGIEDSLWSAIRALEERVLLMRAMADHERKEHGDNEEAMLEDAAATQRRADLVRRATMHDRTDTTQPGENHD